MKKAAIIGAGMGGLSAAHQLVKHGYEVTIFERGEKAGGLAGGFFNPEWDWSVEYFYHHWFKSDKAVLKLIKELGLQRQVHFYHPKTVMYHQGKFFPLDSVGAVLTFPGFSFIEKMRFGLVTAYIRFLARWQPLEKYTAHEWLLKYYGEKIYRINFEPMLKGKFGEYYKDIPMSWFWARFKARSSDLGTFDGGFQAFFDSFVSKLRDLGVKIQFNKSVESIRSKNGESVIVNVEGQEYIFDKVVVTSSPAAFLKLAPQLPEEYKQKVFGNKSIGAVVLLLSMKHPLSREKYYWYNLPKSAEYPFLSLVEHTNFLDPSHFGGEYLVYCGDYLPPEHEYFSLTKEQLIERFIPSLKRINPQFDRSWIRSSWLFRQPYAQPIPELNQSKRLLDIITPIPNVFLITMSQVYPWDRGTNYAVDMVNNSIQTILGES
ncbi:MAG: NAD(P)/FAD-dependent oxidoreductase [Chloroflexi bacterium]|jgi:protoporphyrinogen oxidase|nr:NAD(P)/FAD-dependent oxidoreductase [Chloroflexota bacterium]